MGNISQWNIIGSSKVCIQDNAYEKIICEKMAILSWPQCVKPIILVIIFYMKIHAWHLPLLLCHLSSIDGKVRNVRALGVCLLRITCKWFTRDILPMHCLFCPLASLKTVSCHDANFVNNGGTGGCHWKTCSATSVYKVGIMITVSFQCLNTSIYIN